MIGIQISLAAIFAVCVYIAVLTGLGYRDPRVAVDVIVVTPTATVPR